MTHHEQMVNVAENGLLLHKEEWRTLEQTYQYMLKYTVEGIQERSKIFIGITF